MEITLQSYPDPPVKESYSGTVDEIVNQVKERLDELMSLAPEGERLLTLHIIPSITIGNYKNT